MPKKIPLEDRFMSFTMPVTESGCWLWLGAIDPPGKHRRLPYGKFWMKTKGMSIVAHRAAWIIFKGEIPSEKIVCHKCDVPSCVNPAHLFLGSPKDNTGDMFRKGRAEPMLKTRRGEGSNFVKITADDVIAIRSDPRPSSVLAKEYGLTYFAVRKIRNRENWKHI